MTGRSCARAVAALMIASMSAIALPAEAQQPQQAQTPPLRSSPMVQTPLPEPSALEEHADTIFSAIRGTVRWVIGGVAGLVTPPLALDVARRARQAEAYDFSTMMGIAGYKLKEVESTVSLIPNVGFTFAIERELSDADREWLAIQLDRHRKRRSGLFASAERAIIQALLDAQELGGYQVEKLVVDAFPWPQVKFYITPTAVPLSDETGRLMRAIDRVNETVKATKSQPNDGSVPAAAPRVGVQRTSP